MKSKKQKRAEALLRLERYHAHNPNMGNPDGRVKHIAYLHSIMDRPAGRVRRVKEVEQKQERTPGNPVGRPPYMPSWDEFMGYAP